MKIKIIYNTQIYIEGDTAEDIRNKWESIDLEHLGMEIKKSNVVEVELIGIEEVKIMKESNEFNKSKTDLLEYINNQ